MDTPYPSLIPQRKIATPPLGVFPDHCGYLNICQTGVMLYLRELTHLQLESIDVRNWHGCPRPNEGRVANQFCLQHL